MRLIDADALKRNMEFVCMGIMAGTDPYNAPLKEIDNAPTIEPQQWIPVTERLPKEDTDVLITEEDGCVDIARYDFNMWSEDPIVEWWNGEYRVYPVAWMPLPAPWKGGAE